MSDDPRETLRKTTAARAIAPPAGRLSLLVVGQDGVRTVALPASGEVIVGRSPSCDVCVEDGNLSRRHVALTCGSQLAVRDLGSLNGTFVGDVRLGEEEPFALGIGDAITLGATVLVVQSAQSEGRPRRVWSHGYFEGRVEEECARAERGGGAFAVVRVAVPDASRVGELAGSLSACVRPMDVLAAYAPTEYEVLVLDATADDAARVVARVREDLGRRGITPTVGVSCSARDGRTAERLVAAALPCVEGAAPRLPSHGVPQVVLRGVLARMQPLVDRVAAAEINVLVLGETGVGKELLAHALHRCSPRARHPLQAINCAALAESLLESELFGHERGAFTGAVAAKAGLLEMAEGGTVFLDEVGEMPLPLQAKLLRVLEQREVTRVGSLKSKRIDVRFIAATNRDLSSEVRRGRFRQDLFYRLNGISLTVPPLRERRDEIEELARLFLTQASQRSSAARVPDLAPAALDALHAYAWPGNVRELRNAMERAVILAAEGPIEPEHLPREKMVQIVPTAARTTGAPAPDGANGAAPERRVTAPRGEDHEDDAWDDDGEEAPTRELPMARRLDEDEERVRIQAALAECVGNQTRAAKLLGISRRTLVNRLNRYDIPRPRKRGP